jgi:DNA adenine methylase
MKPIIKWVGGKTQLMDTILPLFPREMNHYHEPFVGGGSVLLGLLRKVRNREITIRGTIHAYDSNPHLIGMYQIIQTKPYEMLHFILDIKTEFESILVEKGNQSPSTKEEALQSKESYYYWIRKRFNSIKPDTCESAALFIFLNKTCFRGIYRVGPNGFNVPYGHNKHPEIINEEHLREFQEFILPVRFHLMSFRDSLALVQKGDFVYLDPPYAPETETSFVAYTEHGFVQKDHLDLFEQCKELPCSWLMSNACTPFVQVAFPEEEDYTIHIVEARRAIHSKNPGHKTREMLIQKNESNE